MSALRNLLAIACLSLIAFAGTPQQTPAPQAAAPADAGIEGVIVRFGTGETLGKATVDLQLVNSPGASLTTTTEGDGRFYFPNIPAGTYRIFSRRDGYWSAEYGQRWIGGPGQAMTVGSGQRLRDVQVVMTPGGVIAGRITNRYGLPLAGARVSALKPWIRENQRQLRSVQDVVANDLGEFRLIWLMPGRYYISATFVDYTPAAQASQLVIDPDAAAGLANGTRSVSRPVTVQPIGNGLAADEVYTPVFFPATLDSDKALAVELQQGQEYRGADITVTPVRTFHVRGVVTELPDPATVNANAAGGRGGTAAGGRGGQAPIAPGGPGGRGAQVQVRLSPTSPNGSLYSVNTEPGTGRFDFLKVIPGGYVAYVFLNGMTIRSNADVRNGDVDGLSLPMASGLDIPINLTFEGERPPNFPNLANLTVTLWRNPTLLSAPAMPATAGNPPVLRNIAPGDYHVYVNPILSALNGANPMIQPPVWQGAYVKSMKLGDVDVLNGGLRLSRAPEVPLDVVIAATPGVLQGIVVNERREPVVGAWVTVFSSSPPDRLYRTDMYQVTSTDTAGRFQIRARPGDYRVFAWENVENGTWMDSTFLRLYEERGVTARVEEAMATTSEIPVIRPEPER
jgi:hypothetical protein